MSLLIIGPTGTLGRQIARKALNEGFQVKCFVRNFKKAAFLKEWGAELVYGDLKIPDTIPATLCGVTAIIDASTSRSIDFDSSSTIEIRSKKILIRAAKLANVRRYIFFSIVNAKRYPHISIMYAKSIIEKELRNSDIDYTIFSIWGFFQGLIQQYAIPILDQQPIWITQENQAIAYADTQDVAEIAIKSLSTCSTLRRTFVLKGPAHWTSRQIIALCEKLSGQKSKISTIPVKILHLLCFFTSLFQWSIGISERLAFTNLLVNKQAFSLSFDDDYSVFHMRSEHFNSLENYLQEYFFSILKKMKELNEQKQNTMYLDSF